MAPFLIGLYIACELIGNVTASKPVRIGGIVVPAAIFIYTLTFTLIDLINETFGKQGARKVIAAAVASNLLLAAYTQLAVVLPSPSFYKGQDAFVRVLGNTPRIVLASLAAYLVSSLIDAEVFAFWKVHVRGPKWARVLVSNGISTVVDSAIFIFLAFYGVMPVWILIQGQYIVKMAITVVSLPMIYLVGNKADAPGLGRRTQNRHETMR
jgi:queuosine precursor transporter